MEFTVTIDKNPGWIFFIFHIFDPPPGVWKIPIMGSKFKIVADPSYAISKLVREAH